jgi:hypothetical protein
MSAAIIIGVQCRLCGRVISQAMLALAHKLYGDPLGNAEKGYICWDCHNKHRIATQKLGQQLTEFWTVYLDVSSIDSPPCALCGTLEGEDRLGPVMIDGTMGFVCLPCEPRYNNQTMRDRTRGTRYEYDLKLR